MLAQIDLRVELEAFRRRELRHAVSFAVRTHDRLRLRGGALRGFRVLFQDTTDRHVGHAKRRRQCPVTYSIALEAEDEVGALLDGETDRVGGELVLAHPVPADLSRGVSEGDPRAPVVCLGDQVVKAFLAFRGLVELFLDVADELFGLFAGEVALVRVDAHVDGQVVARVFDDRVAGRGLPRFRLVYDADRLGSALGRLRLLHGGHVDDLDVLPCGFVL